MIKKLIKRLYKFSLFNSIFFHSINDKKIAIIMATPPGVNCGMLMCEANAHSFIKQAGLLKNTTFFRILSLEERLKNCDLKCKNITLSKCDIGIKYEILTDLSKLNDHIIIFWGDFLHSLVYIKSIAPFFSNNILVVRKLLLLENEYEHLQNNAISYATSLIFNSTEDYFESDYSKSLNKFIKNLSHIQMRDAISSSIVSGLRLKNDNCFGVDAAQLISINSYLNDFFSAKTLISHKKKKRALIFFARGYHVLDHLKLFIDDILKNVEMYPEHLEWGDKLSFPFKGEMWNDITSIKFKENIGINYLQNILAEIRNSSLVITDTYHLCVISWALGVPAIMFSGDYHDGEKKFKEVGLRSRNDKRRILMAQEGLLDFFIEPSFLIGDKREDIINRLVNFITNKRFINDYEKKLSARAEFSHKCLLKAIKSIC